MFLDFKSELEEVYKVYCQNHDDAIALLESYEKDENVQKQVLECLENLRLDRVNICTLQIGIGVSSLQGFYGTTRACMKHDHASYCSC